MSEINETEARSGEGFPNNRVAALMEEFGPAEVLRAITRYAHERYEEHTRKRSRRFLRQPEKRRAAENFLSHEPPRRERRENDIALAWLCLDLDYAARDWEERMETAGMSNKERCERDKAAKLSKLKRQLQSLEQTDCAG